MHIVDGTRHTVHKQSEVMGAPASVHIATLCASKYHGRGDAYVAYMRKAVPTSPATRFKVDVVFDIYMTITGILH